jgi:hypothetical protein
VPIVPPVPLELDVVSPELELLEELLALVELDELLDDEVVAGPPPKPPVACVEPPDAQPAMPTKPTAHAAPTSKRTERMGES